MKSNELTSNQNRDNSFFKNISYICLAFFFVACLMIVYFVGSRYVVVSMFKDTALAIQQTLEKHNPFKKPEIKQRTVIVPRKQNPTPTPQQKPKSPPPPQKYMVELTNGENMIIERYDLKGGTVELFIKNGFSMELAKSQIRSIKKI